MTSQACTEKPKPWVTMLTLPNPYSKTGGRTIVLAFRNYRSKWWRLQCFCKSLRCNPRTGAAYARGPDSNEGSDPLRDVRPSDPVHAT